LPQKGYHREIHPRPTRSRNHGDVQHRFMRKAETNSPLMSTYVMAKKALVA
jgi:hypothetical protein